MTPCRLDLTLPARPRMSLCRGSCKFNNGKPFDAPCQLFLRLLFSIYLSCLLVGMAFSMVKVLAFTAACASFLQPASAVPSKGKLPVVDLGYELQRATLFNESGNFYNFSNIRYAAPPVGDLRFRAPQPPKRLRGEVQTGLPDRICAQASPAWGLITQQ